MSRTGLVDGSGRDGPGGHVSRRGALLGAGALASAFALSACGMERLPDTAAADSPEVVVPEAVPDTVPELRSRIDAEDGVAVAGKPLNTKLLKRFYARHDYAPVWASRPEQADSLGKVVARAHEHGLDPELFQASLLQGGAELSAPDRELAMSNAFLCYADALARGAVPVERRKSDQVLAPDPVDVAELMDQALASSDAGAAIEALAPATPAYRALREALAAARTDAVPGSKAPVDRLRAIEVNLERQRWLPRTLPSDRVWVNVADERLVMYRADDPKFSTRVVVGEDVEKNQSPEFRATIDASFYNPPWVIPADIAAAEILPKLDHDPEYLTRNKMVMLAHGEVEQLPGPDAGLGLIMFDMPNKFDVYLHDTPDRTVFARDNRRISHGCIRVQNPRELAAWLMDQPLEAIDEGIAAGSTTRNDLPKPVPVFVVYQTAFLDTDGQLQYRPDFYRRDAAVWRAIRTGVPPESPPALAVRTARVPAPHPHGHATHASDRRRAVHHPGHRAVPREI